MATMKVGGVEREIASVYVGPRVTRVTFKPYKQPPSNAKPLALPTDNASHQRDEWAYAVARSRT